VKEIEWKDTDFSQMPDDEFDDILIQIIASGDQGDSDEHQGGQNTP
jgi:hypothetical protein